MALRINNEPRKTLDVDMWGNVTPRTSLILGNTKRQAFNNPSSLSGFPLANPFGGSTKKPTPRVAPRVAPSNQAGPRDFAGARGKAQTYLNKLAKQLGSRQEEEAGPPVFGKTLADYLAQAQGMTSSSMSATLQDLAAQRAALQQQASTGDQRLAAMYAALNNLTTQSNQADQTRYATAQDTSKQITADTLAAVQAANAKAAQNQAQTQANLGIDPGASNTQTEYAQMNNSGIGTVGNAATQQLIANGVAQGDYGRAMGSAGDFAGASARSNLQQALMNALADLSSKEASIKDTSSSQAQDLAAQLYGADRNAWEWDQNFAAGRDDEAWNRAKSNAPVAGPTPTGSSLAVQLLGQSNLNKDVASTIFDYINQGASEFATKKSQGKGTSLQTEFLNLLNNDPYFAEHPQERRVALNIAQQSYGEW